MISAKEAYEITKAAQEINNNVPRELASKFLENSVNGMVVAAASKGEHYTRILFEREYKSLDRKYLESMLKEAGYRAYTTQDFVNIFWSD